ncbi:hypothetical protein [Pedobacter sp. MR2016-24]|uniref:primase 1D-like protein n=1 Tax=Pedobacter sp. MR2016-24 TaxID=2994466 RepID=UPI002246BA5C|nr:hypothetical protein [Pedobacter sp. MR2016-24]MCX2483527.1 hypothetical protein [Pedobacter sp. MR2016-24]
MRNSGQFITEWLLSEDGIVSINLVVFPDIQPLQNRFDLAGSDSEAVSKALEIRALYALPFWDCLLLTQFDPTLFAQRVIKEAMLHNTISSLIQLSRKEIVQLPLILEEETRNIGINSRVLMNDGREMHIPLLDFHIPSYPANDRSVIAVLKELNLRGHLFRTNRSYHFIGEVLMDQTELVAFLSKAILLSPIIDKNWIAHQLIEGSCTIRLTRKAGQYPLLISKV